MATKKTSIGGQALLEGIMMRGPEKTAMAVRNSEGEIVLEEYQTKGKNRPAICKKPFVRGIFNMGFPFLRIQMPDAVRGNFRTGGRGRKKEGE